MTTDLNTTNVLLGIMAAVSLLEALAILGLSAAGALLYRRVLDVVRGIEARQVAPAVDRVNAILDDVKNVTAIVKDETARIDRLMHVAGDVIAACRTSPRTSSTPS